MNAWAEQVSTPEHNADRMTFRTDWVVDSHPAILDGFATMFREELDVQKEDGCVNNVPKKPRRIGGRWSVLDRLHIKQAERRQKDNAPQQEQERSRKS